MALHKCVANVELSMDFETTYNLEKDKNAIYKEVLDHITDEDVEKVKQLLYDAFLDNGAIWYITDNETQEELYFD